MNTNTSRRLWAIVPAAGIGSRMQSKTAKQYLPLLGKTLLEVTLEKLLQLDELEGIVVALHAHDRTFMTLPVSQHPKIHTTVGGKERSDSVQCGLYYCAEQQVESSEPLWVLVHDAARPCVSLEKIQALISATVPAQDGHGAILAVPCADTIKRVSQGHIEHTEDRSTLWLAHTPQLFSLDALGDALTFCRKENIQVTDEASAIEASGGSVSVVQDRRDNIKVTVPEDLAWAETILKQQGMT